MQFLDRGVFSPILQLTKVFGNPYKTHYVKGKVNGPLRDVEWLPNSGTDLGRKHVNFMLNPGLVGSQGCEYRASDTLHKIKIKRGVHLSC
jgi:hypothetical protein